MKQNHEPKQAHNLVLFYYAILFTSSVFSEFFSYVFRR